ncbi:PAS domain-containing sensor histidine kinase [Desulfonatronovibrio hydrogenovorans]|uniref:PAS domain-containing sensor histidine kinase n=1 Tax=Desulfonatronovibrio hydrogenovorans TaxID=53245 RepID=UPI00049103BC|nr:PAS domain-containing sensor histidine kinase [Desulfonatronovibrio hydrogenovorans]
MDKNSKPSALEKKIDQGLITGSPDYSGLNPQEALQAERDILKSIMAAAPVAIIVFDQQARILDANRVAMDMFQSNQKMIPDGRCGDFINCIHRLSHPEGCGYSIHCPLCEIDSAIKQALKDETPISGMETHIIRTTESDPEKIWVRFSAEPVVLLGKPSLIVAMEDITDRKLAEEEIKLKNEQLETALAEKEKLFSIIAHDLKSPFSGFLGITGLMAEDPSRFTLNELQELSAQLNQSAENLYDLLVNLLEWSSMRRGLIGFEPEPCSVLELIQSNLKLFKTLAGQKSIQLSKHIPEDIVVMADRHLLSTILRNLLSNAIKFTGQNGKVSISAQSSDEGLQVTVTDTGTGIPAMILKNMFTLNRQTPHPGTEGEKGTGLGLLLCKECVEKHGGKIWAENLPDQGAAFHFTLPVNNHRTEQPADIS